MSKHHPFPKTPRCTKDGDLCGLHRCKLVEGEHMGIRYKACAKTGQVVDENVVRKPR